MDPYRISVSIHDVQRIELQAARTIRGSDRVCRDIVIYDAHGERLVIQCFAENVDALTVRDRDFAEIARVQGYSGIDVTAKEGE